MLDAFSSGLVTSVTLPALPLMLVGIAIGFVVGLLPGLGGAVTLALMIPFIFGMDQPIMAFAFLLGMHSVVQTTGDVTSVLFGVPGEGTAAATIVDGHPMARRGEAGRALGAALFSSMIGAILGAFALAAAVPIVQPLVLAMGSPEMFMLTLLGVSFIAFLSGGSIIRGVASGLVGFLLATIGMSSQAAAIPRFAFGSVYLFDGISLVPVTIGLFAIPEIIDLAIRGTSIAETEVGRLVGVWQGIKDTLRHWGLTIRSSLVGAFIGIIPGMGGSVAQWMAYGHAVQSSRDKSRFGQGAVEGVIGPGAANNSKEGGSLIPTVAFGVPGSVSTAILLGAFLILDLEPGPSMLRPPAEGGHLDVTFSMVWIIVVANIITVIASLALLNQIAKITLVRASRIIPFLLLLVVVGSFATNNDFGDILLMLGTGLLGYLMVLFRWPRPPLILGLVLGGLAERFLFISVQRYEAAWVASPGVIVILVLILAGLAYPLLQRRRKPQRETEAVSDEG